MSNREIIQKIKDLKSFEAGGRPSDAWTLSNREILMSQICPQVVENRTTKSEKVYYWQYFSNVFSQKVVRPVAISFMVVALLLTYNIVVNKANASLPGDAFYPIKITAEKIQEALAFSDEAKINLIVDKNNTRADEISQLAMRPEQEGQVGAINNLTSQIAQNSQDLKEKLKQNQNDPKAVSLAATVEAGTSQTVEKLNSVKLSPEIKDKVAPALAQATLSAKETGTDALKVLADNQRTSNPTVPDTDVAGRLNGQVKADFESIKDLTAKINSLSVPAVATTISGKETKNTSSTIDASSTPTKITSVIDASTTKDLLEKLKKASTTLDQVDGLLEKKDTAGALIKLKEADAIIAEVSKFVSGFSEQPKVEVKDIDKPVVTSTATSTIDKTDKDTKVVPLASAK
ncbi:MAG: DUF5667 domain-containing protein [bacterium]